MAYKDFVWAANKVKLQQSFDALKVRGVVEPSEKEVKDEYVKRAGRLLEVASEDDEPKALADLSVKELKKLAKEKEVDLGDATKQADIVAALEAAGVSL